MSNSFPSESPNMFDFENIEPLTDDSADSRYILQCSNYLTVRSKLALNALFSSK